MAAFEPVRGSILRIGLPSYTLPPHEITYTYLFGGDDLVLFDVGARPGEGGKLLHAVEELGKPVRTVILSHHHPDHVSGLKEVYEPLGRPFVRAHPWTREYLASSFPGIRFGPDLSDGEVLKEGDVEARVLYTPGHAPGHVSLYLPREEVVLLGDLLVGEGSGTVVIAPPEGDLLAYEESLHRVAALGDVLGAPAHGDLLPSVEEGAKRALAHKGEREAQVVAALRRHAEGARLEDLLTQVYGDNLGEPVAFLASKTLLAHLLKLEAQGRARQDGEGRWYSDAENL
ncbi:MAG: MBL fold metallo-hydrolase [Clostridiales bacterium]|nr:MBL fold metallo-hydrolase [Clostridiales bacterium]